MGLDELRRSRTALLTTYRRSGEPVATPVSVAVGIDRVYFVTAVDSGKARRIAHDARVVLAPSTVSGEHLGPEVAGRARLLDVVGVRRLMGLTEPAGVWQVRCR